jgi:polar amino acid transport system substrate-binding protein
VRSTLLVLAALALAATARADSLDDIKARGELRWGADIQGGEPYVYENPDDPSKIIGFEVDIAESLARRLGVKATFVQIAWSSLVPGLERGDYDIALNGLEATGERRDRLLLSDPYYIYAETLAVKQGSSLRFYDMRGRRVGTLNQTYAFDLLRDLGAQVVPYEGVQEPYEDLKNERIDGVLLDNVIADRYGCNAEGVLCVPGDGALGSYVAGLRKGDTRLHAAVNQALADMKKDGELRQILERAKLWDHRQEIVPPEAGLSASRTKRSFGMTHLRLFAEGAWVTLQLSVLAFLIAMVLGLLLAVGRVYGHPILRGLSAGFVEVFRGTPVLLQVYVLYFGLAPILKLDAFQAAVLGLGLNYAAYEAEIYRGAILALPRGQTEAADSIGLSGWQTLRHVLLPQALRIALPPMTNDFVALLKDSAVVSVITVVELTKRMTIAAVDLRDWLVPGLVCAVLYFAMSFPLAQLARVLERRLRRDPHPGSA